jgi:hypothetical protein
MNVALMMFERKERTMLAVDAKMPSVLEVCRCRLVYPPNLQSFDSHPNNMPVFHHFLADANSMYLNVLYPILPSFLFLVESVACRAPGIQAATGARLKAILTAAA